MNNKLIIPVGIGAVAVIGMLGFIIFRNSSDKPSQQAVSIQESGEQVLQDQKSPEELTQAVREAFDGNGSVKCMYNDEGYQTVSYIKNGMIRIDVEGSGENNRNSSMIFKDPNVYIWESGAIEGYMFDSSVYSESDLPGGEQFSNPDEIRSEVETNAVTCAEEEVDDSLFEVPDNVTFQDMSEGIKEILDQVPDNMQLPEGFQLP